MQYSLVPFLLLLLSLHADEPVVASDIHAASIGLRGGYDDNPKDAAGGRGGFFIAPSVAWDYLNGSEKSGFGISVSSSAAFHDPRAVAPSHNHSVTFKHATSLTEYLLLRGSLQATHLETWSRKRSDLVWRERIEYERGALRLFATGEAKFTSLNERNIVAFGGFLPENEHIATPALVAGAAWKQSWGEFGASLTLAHARWINGADYIGLARDNHRIQPNLFFSTTIGGVSMEGSLSYLVARFPAGDFDDVRRILYTAKAKIPLGKFAFELASARSIDDTTLPFSVINLTSLHEAKITAPLGEASSVALFARLKHDDYVGLDAQAHSASVGLEYSRALGKGLTALASASWRRTRETGADPIRAFNVSFGLQQALDFNGASAGPKEASGRPQPVNRSSTKPARS